MRGLYLILDLLTIAGPLMLSFDKRVRFYKSWKSAVLASLIVGIPFLIWDALFTANGFWGFNEDYLVGINFLNLPLEEWLFFLVVPIACTFIFEVCNYFFRNIDFTQFNRFFALGIALYAVLLLFMGNLGYYTLSVQISAALVLAWLLLQPPSNRMGIAFLISLIPFFMVNGILTGCCTEAPVVWYSEAQKVAPRLFTIPMEDVLYSFSLLIPNMILFEFFEKRRKG